MQGEAIRKASAREKISFCIFSVDMKALMSVDSVQINADVFVSLIH